MKIYTAQMMRAADMEAIEKYAIDSIILMENAGAAIEKAVCEHIGKKDVRVLALCGKGNNGGDGFCAARRLMQRGVYVEAVLFDDEKELSGDNKKNFDIYKNIGGKIIYNIEEFEKRITEFDVLIDALYGFGFHGELSGHDRRIAEIVNKSDIYVVAADVPSGVWADKGEYNFAIKADKTVTFTGYKPAHLQFDAADACGEVEAFDIGIPRCVCDGYGIGETIEKEFVKKNLPIRERGTHKGSCGKVFIVGGSVGMSGAVCMSAASCMRSGAGLVTAGVPEGINVIFEKTVAEAMSIPLCEDENGVISEGASEKIIDFANKSDVLIIGPGMGRTDGVEHIVRECIKRYEKKIVIDADALYALSKDVDMLLGAKADIIITPHYAEMARLLGCDVEYVKNNAILCAKEFSEKYNVTVVLKGAYTVIAGDKSLYVNNSAGNAGMATGGSGDVLSGVIGSLFHKIDSVPIAAACGVYVHALAGDVAKERLGEEAMCATDIMHLLGDAFRIIRQD